MKLFDVFSLYDIEPVRGLGNHVYTADGTEYLDLYGGHAVISIGHAHHTYVTAIAEQVSKLDSTLIPSRIHSSRNWQTVLADCPATMTMPSSYATQELRQMKTR